MKFMNVSYTLYTDSLNVIFLCLCFGCNPSCEVRCVIFHLWNHIGAQKASGFGAFHILDVYIRNAEPVVRCFRESTQYGLFFGIICSESCLTLVIFSPLGGLKLLIECFFSDNSSNKATLLTFLV